MENIDQLKNLIVMAAADGKFAQSELELLAERCHQFGLSQQQFEQAFAEATQQDAKFVIPTEQTEKTVLMRDLLRMMAADGELSSTEKKLFAQAAVQMKMDRVEIDEIIDQMLISREIPKRPKWA